MVKGDGKTILLALVLLLSITILSTSIFAAAEGEECSSDFDCDAGLFCEATLLRCMDESILFGEGQTQASTVETSTSQETSSDISCVTDENCVASLGEGYYCSSNFICEEELIIEIDMETVEENAYAINDLQTQTESINQRLTGIETRLVTTENTLVETSLQTQAQSAQTQESLTELTTKVDTLNTNIQMLSTDQNQLERNVEQEVNTLQAQVGNSIATLEQELSSAKGELDQTNQQLQAQAKQAKNYRIATGIVATLALFSALAYVLMLHQKRNTDLPKEAKEFITAQIKAGQSKHAIVKALMHSGWEESDAQWAYDHTKAENYNDYLISQGKDPKELPARKGAKGHHQKALAISVISVLVLAVMLFAVKNSVGNAVYVPGTGTQGDLDESVELLLETYINQNSFYSAINYIEGCVQVEDGTHSTSWLVLKTPYGHSITENDPCEWDPTDYDFAVKFTNYATFENTVSSLSCTSASLAHQVVSGSTVTRGMYVLPSYYIEEGMSTRSGYDYSDFCTALSLCFSASDIQTLGISDCVSSS